MTGPSSVRCRRGSTLTGLALLQPRVYAVNPDSGKNTYASRGVKHGPTRIDQQPDGPWPCPNGHQRWPEDQTRTRKPLTHRLMTGEPVPLRARPGPEILSMRRGEMSKAVDEFCPACGVTPGQTCRNLATSQPMYRDGRPVTHPARGEETWRNPALLTRRGQLREVNPELYAPSS